MYIQFNMLCSYCAICFSAMKNVEKKQIGSKLEPSKDILCVCVAPKFNPSKKIF